jgi:hypothetical protein
MHPLLEDRARPDDRAGSDAGAFEIGERADPRALPTVTPELKVTFGSITTSRPSFVSALKNTVSGATSVTPASIAARRSRRCISASASASSARELMPISSSAGSSIVPQFRPLPRAISTMSVR